MTSLRLTISSNGKTVEERQLAPGTYTLGRLAENDIHLDDHRVSRHHANLEVSDSMVVVEDHDSTNGIKVAGRKVKRAELKPGDTLTIEPFKLLMGSTDPAEQGRTVVIDEKPAFHERGTVVLQQTESPRLLVKKGPTTQPTFLLKPGTTLIGRSPKCDIHLSQGSVSRRHAQLMVTPQRIVLKDAGSKGGTFVNGKKIQEVELAPNDVIGIGPVELVLHVGCRTTSGEADLHNAAPRQVNLSPKPNRQLGKLGKGLLWGLVAAGLLLAVLLAMHWSNLNRKEDEQRLAREMAIRQQQAELALRQKKVAKLIQRAQGSADTGQLRESLEFINQALSQEPKNQTALALKNRVQEQIAKAEEARKLKLRQEQERNRRAEALLEQARVAMDKKQFSLAVELSRQAQEIRPQDMRAAIMLRRAQGAIKAQQEAQQQKEEKRNRQLTAAHKYYELGLKNMRRGQLTQAALDWNRVLKIDPSNQAGYTAKARKSLAEAKPRLGRQTSPLIAQAESLLGKDDLVGAIKLLKQATAIDPWNSRAHRILEQTTAKAGTQAKELYQEGLVLESFGEIDKAATKWHQVMILASQGDPYYARAKDKLKKYRR